MYSCFKIVGRQCVNPAVKVNHDYLENLHFDKFYLINKILDEDLSHLFDLKEWYVGIFMHVQVSLC